MVEHFNPAHSLTLVSSLCLQHKKKDSFEMFGYVSLLLCQKRNSLLLLSNILLCASTIQPYV